MGWIQVVRRRRKKSARSEKSGSTGNLNVMMDLNKGRSLVWYWKVEGFQEFMPQTFASFKMGGSETQPYFLENSGGRIPRGLGPWRPNF